MFALALTTAGAAEAQTGFYDTTETVGHHAGYLETPVNQKVTPAGRFIELPGMRPNALALSPDGRLLVTSGLTPELVVLNPASGEVLQHVFMPPDTQLPTSAPVPATILNPTKNDKLSFTGLAFSPDGSRLYLANVNGDIKVFSVSRDHKVASLFSIPLPPANAPHRKAAIPAGIAVSRDGKTIFVALNLSNRLAELDAATGRVLLTWNVGVAPFGVALADGKVYVSNWGGRRPDAASVTGPAGRGMRVRVDARSIANEGSVSVIDPSSPGQAEQKEILTGLRTCGMAVSPDGRWLAAANAGSDTISVIDTHVDQIVETICARQNPADLFGAQPNALAYDRRGRRLFVCNGMQNAVAVIRFKPGNSRLEGLIPVGWFPGSIACVARNRMLAVANIKSISPKTQRAGKGKGKGKGFNTKQYYGSLSLVRLPSRRKLRHYTRLVLANLRYPLLAQAALPARPDRAPQPVPERVGEPSVFQHVIYIIKENRSYDQVLGDVAEGNGDPDLCVFGERVTPNQHKLVREFALLDNTYCSSILSADGHEWADSAMATDYIEREFAGWPRSYPAGGDSDELDAIAYSPAGFIWDDALEHGETLRDMGEFCVSHKKWREPGHKHAPNFLDCYHQFLNGTTNIAVWCVPDVEPLRPYADTNTVGWDLSIPDAFRAAQFKKVLKECERVGSFPNLLILWLPNDHTSGTRHGSPTPEAQVADNDLAVGKVVEAVSHSPFWTNTCIFAIEDDPQDGWDHVSGYRTTAYVISPYTRRHAVIHTQYNQTSLLRTIELILRLPPMNQMDATATPMFDCFTNTPDFTPFSAVPNQVALDEMNPSPKKISDRQLRKDAYVSAHLPLDKEDECPEDVFNHILWRAMKGSHTPYPAWAVKPANDGD